MTCRMRDSLATYSTGFKYTAPLVRVRTDACSSGFCGASDTWLRETQHMAFLHDDGELLVLNSAFGGRTVEVGLFDDSTDQLTDSDGFSSITTEPSASDYSPQSVTDPAVSQNSGTTSLSIGTLSFQVSNATSSVNYVYVRDSSSGDLIFTNSLDQSYDLTNIDTLDLGNVGIELE